MRRSIASALLVLLLGGCGELLVPREAFDDTVPPPAPSYAEESSWAALPWREDEADVLVDGETDGQADAAVDVFFIHPTTYYSPATWNQPLDHEASNTRTDEGVMRNQASAYNRAARVFAPRYRQATLGAFTTDRVDEADAALDLAYGDVLAAFDHYLSAHSDGRPIVIASHSQGSRHAMRLLSERFSDRAADPSLRDRLVAAYVIGFAFPLDVLERVIPGIPLCATPEQTGCLVTWSSVREGSAPRRFDSVRVAYPEGVETVERPTLLCVNAVTWRADSESSALDAHLGAAQFDDAARARAVPGALRARCTDQGLLAVDVTGDYDPGRSDDFHIHDYGLFYLDLRANVAERAAAFLGAP